MQWASPSDGLPVEIVCDVLSQLTSRASCLKQHILQTISCCKADSEEDEDVIGAFLHRYSIISHWVPKNGDVSMRRVEKEESKPRVCKAKCLMYIDVKINENQPRPW
ncbi:Uncharacterized protein Adt_41045 [Abeliophyllum distichum]|uniref:Uncharacterized protein n=1 Tax=Abeliophyllum distichum TaxID=126358 RepID=A0ABD1PNI3_9LAMI